MRYAVLPGNSSAPAANPALAAMAERLGVGSKVVTTESIGQQKMSEVLEEFLAPLVGDATGTPLAQLRSVFGFGVVVWNLALTTETQEDFDAAFGELLGTFSEEPEERDALTSQARALASRKRLLFPEDQRVIASFNLHYVGKVLRLEVASVPLKPRAEETAG